MIELNQQERISEFVSFCIENFKIKHSMHGKDVANLFKASGVLGFIIDGYEILHTQGRENLERTN